MAELSSVKVGVPAKCEDAFGVERINSADTTIAFVVRGDYQPDRTEFVTPEHLSQQVGLICCRAGKVIPRHVHNPVRRTIHGTSEAIFVRKGVVQLRLYDDNRTFVTSRCLSAGDLVFMVAGGHGFEVVEDAVFLEVKQGPYVGPDDKTRF